MILSDLLQNLDLTLQDVSFIREVFHELHISAANSHKQSLNMNLNLLGQSKAFTKKSERVPLSDDVSVFIRCYLYIYLFTLLTL